MLTILYYVSIIAIIQIFTYNFYGVETYIPNKLQDSNNDRLKLKHVAKNHNSRIRNALASELQNEVKFFESIIECSSTKSTSVRSVNAQKSKRQKSDKSFTEIKALLFKLIDKMRELEKEKRDDADDITRSTTEILKEVESKIRKCNLASSLKSPRVTAQPRIAVNVNGNKYVRMKKKKDENLSENRRQRWGHWTDWSSCSVSCGKGRQIRWRHCVENCDEAETEMEEKTCQLPACGPGKLFGVIQL